MVLLSQRQSRAQSLTDSRHPEVRKIAPARRELPDRLEPPKREVMQRWISKTSAKGFE